MSAALITQSLAAQQHRWQDLVEVFNHCFLETYNTELVKGGDEPIYLPADDDHPHHRIIFAHGFFASGLHEISHWCIAGTSRRLREDFGYWYEPDGRSAVQQAEFEQVEIKPQALEWIFAKACGFRFRVSTDNLNGEWTDNSAFKSNVYRQVMAYMRDEDLASLPERPRMLVKAFSTFYQTDWPQTEHFSLQELG